MSEGLVVRPPVAVREWERLTRASARLGGTVPPPEPRGWERWRARLKALAQSGELARRAVVAAPLVAIAFAVFAFGGVYGWAYGGAYVLIFAALGTWSVQCWRGVWRARWRAVYTPLVAFTVWALLQSAAGLSVIPASTNTQILHLGAGMVTYVLVGQVYRPETDARPILTALALLTAALSALAIMQMLTASNGIYWHFTYAYATPAGSFVNHNNFAGCMEMLIPAAVAAAYQHRRRSWLRWVAWLLAPVLGLVAMVLAASRGGLLALGIEAMVGLGLYAWLRRPGSRPRWGVAALALALAGAFVAAAGPGRLIQRLQAGAAHGPDLEQRHELNLSSWTMFRAAPVSGWGLGTWSQVYPVYARFDDGATYGYAHNDYLQLLAETGLVGTGCGLAFWSLWGGDLRRRWLSWRRERRGSSATALGLAAVIASAGMLAHSWVDFNLHIPANLLLFMVLLALAAAPDVKDAARERWSDPAPGENAREYDE